MIECILAVICVITAAGTNEPLYMVAAGAFAIACNINGLKKLK